VESFCAEKNAEVMDAILKMVAEGNTGGRGRGGGGGRGGGEGEESKIELGPPPEQGTIYRECNVKGVHAFGVFVEILPGYEGLVHISELDTKKLASAEKMFEVGLLLLIKLLLLLYFFYMSLLLLLLLLLLHVTVVINLLHAGQC
jgi:polyribonucleotide nucleotidyltransferase